MESTALNLEPTEYHQAMAEYLRSAERELWNWFSSSQAKTNYTETLRLSLLKNTYRLDAEGHPELAQTVEEAKTALGLDFPVTVYQAQQSEQLNATLFYIPGEGHVVISGPLLSTLTPIELKSVLGHELAHYLLWQQAGGDYLVAERILQAIAEDPRAASAHELSAQRYRLYTEIFADRGSMAVTKDLNSVVSGLVKVSTGLHQVSGVSYLKQADEIFAQSKIRTEGISHPETFIRARALRLWVQGEPEAERQVKSMIEGDSNLEQLDLLEQVRLTDYTRRLLAELLRPKWFQTDLVLVHARHYFADFKIDPPANTSPLEALASADAKIRDCFGYILLDFVVADQELEDLPLAAAWQMACRIGIESQFEKILSKELKVKPREIKRLKLEATERLEAGAGRLSAKEAEPIS